jgi:hypothetical protein
MKNGQTGRVEINFQPALSDNSSLQRLRSLLSNCEGEYPLYLRILLKDAVTVISTGMKISLRNDVISRVEEIVGKGAID